MELNERFAHVISAIKNAATDSGRSADAVTLVAVSKTKSVEMMNEYAAIARSSGIPVVFGENYLQELQGKKAFLEGAYELHMIGPLQSNKVRAAVELCDVIESVHSVKILQTVVKEARRNGKKQRILLQVNIGRDPSKSGFAPEDVEAAINLCQQSADVLQLEGLMTILPYDTEPEKARPHYRELYALRRRLEESPIKEAFHNSRVLLSMGMSQDFHVAISEGADLIRVGTALFGER